MYHLKTLFKSFLFVTAQAHGAVRGNQYLSCQKYLTEVLTSQMQKEKSCTSPILDDGITVYDRWSQEQKCKQKNNKDMVGMEDIERSLPFTVDWKVALSKRNLSLF